MKAYPELEEIHDTLCKWRRDIHSHPELAFEEHRTAKFVAAKLQDAGIVVHSGVGGTGVVGTLARGSGDKAIGLRADLDALSMQEVNEFAHKSVVDGKFHGCGHDGHTVMLLAAARHLAEHSTFNGTVNFIFQPAEEGAGGAETMIRDGLFETFPMQSVHAMHNSPGMAVGSFAIRPGPMLAAFESFDVTVRGIGGHGALPHHCIDPIVISSQIVQSLQSIVSRSLDPLQAGVVSITKIHAGDAYNVIPAEVTLSGGIRFLDTEAGSLIKRRMTELVTSIAAASKGTADINFHQLGYPPLVNDTSCTKTAISVAQSLVGDENVDSYPDPVMGSDDFASMMQRKPGTYMLIGNGTESHGGCMVHHPEYDFNDEIIPLGASYWIKLVETELG